MVTNRVLEWEQTYRTERTVKLHRALELMEDGQGALRMAAGLLEQIRYTDQAQNVGALAEMVADERRVLPFGSTPRRGA